MFATRVVRHFALDRHLEGIYGSELDGTRSDKRELMAHRPEVGAKIIALPVLGGLHHRYERRAA